MPYQSRVGRSRHDLAFLSGALVVASLGYIPLTEGPMITDIPEVIIPLVVSVALAAFTVRSQKRGYTVAQIRRIATFGWSGALITALVGGWWVVLYRYRDLPISGLTDQVLTVVSLGVGAGVLAGSYGVHRQLGEDTILAETAWTRECEPNPILVAVARQIAELEGVDPVELDPLYAHVNPDVFTELADEPDTTWQVRFRVDSYEVLVSSEGTVTVFDAGSSADPVPGVDCGIRRR